MKIEEKLPELGEGVEEAGVIKVLVSAGDEVKPDNPLIEIETEKATVEVPASRGGKVLEVKVKPGDQLHVGDTIAVLESAAEGSGSGSGPEKTGEREEPSKPQQAAEETQGKKKAPEAEGGKKEVAEAGRGEEDSEETAGKAEAKREGGGEDPAPGSGEGRKKAPVPAAPSVRRFAFEIGIPIEEVQGSGPTGRLSIDDVKKYAKARNRARAGGAAASSAAVGAARALPDFSQYGETAREPMNKIKALTGERMAWNWTAIPHVTQFDRADVTQLEKLRQKYQEQVEKKGGKLTPTAILVKVAAAALGKFPQFNASVDPAAREIVFKRYIHVGIAVDTPGGLVVPVIRHADRKNLTEISVELSSLAQKARDKKLQVAEMQGSCFTITNLGSIGGTHFTPIVNWPEVAILGVSRSAWEPVYLNGSFEPRLKMPLCLSYDHRAIDGADGARFLGFVCAALEDPFILALGG